MFVDRVILYVKGGDGGEVKESRHVLGSQLVIL